MTDPPVGAARIKLSVDAMAISYRSSIGPFAQGDAVVTFIDLLKEATVPIVLYRPASATTDLGLYGSSHVGILGGIIKPTNVEHILQLDLLKTDYFHAEAYPTFLYYNPHASAKTVEIDVGPEAKDIYDAVSDRVSSKECSRPRADHHPGRHREDRGARSGGRENAARRQDGL